MRNSEDKVITITESELKALVKEEVKKQLSMLMEYAIPRRKFVDNAYNLSSQIIENWCLIRYSSIIGRKETKEHWKQELFAHMDNVSKALIKKNNSYETRLKAIQEGFEMNDLYSGVERIKRLTFAKFKIERIDINTNEYLQCIEDCFQSIDEIANVMAKYDPSLLWKYIEDI